MWYVSLTLVVYHRSCLSETTGPLAALASNKYCSVNCDYTPLETLEMLVVWIVVILWSLMLLRISVSGGERGPTQRPSSTVGMEIDVCVHILIRSSKVDIPRV